MGSEGAPTVSSTAELRVFAEPVPPTHVEEVCGVEVCGARMTWSADGKEVCPKCGWSP